MTIHNAATVYYQKMGVRARWVDTTNSRLLCPRVAILKDAAGKRLACVVESKRGYVVDVVKKLH